MITDLIQSCLQPNYSSEHHNKLFESSGFTKLIKNLLSTTKFPEKISFDEAIEFIHMAIVDNGGIPDLGETDHIEIEVAFSSWIIEVLMSALTTYNNLCTPALLECTIACCQNNFSRRALHKFIVSPDLKKLVNVIVSDKFIESEFENSLFSSKRELQQTALGILFEKLVSKSGFPDKWMKFSVRRLSGTINLWVKHRLKDAVRKGRKNNDRFDNFTNDKGEENLVLGTANGTNELLELNEDQRVRERLTEFIRNIPLIAIVNTIKMMESEKHSWVLFLKLNPMNLVQWLMAHPKYCCQEETFVFLANAAKLPLSVRSRWLNELPHLIEELRDSPTSHVTKAKDFTLFAFEDASVKSIEAFRDLKDLTTRRESFRQRNNNTNAGVHMLLILTLLTLKSPSQKGKKVLELLFELYVDSANKIYKTNWPIEKSTLKQWAQCEQSFSAIKVDFMDMVARLRYGASFAQLSKKQQDNVKKIIRMVRNTGYIIAKSKVFSITAR